jgi:hypothetical protein
MMILTTRGGEHELWSCPVWDLLPSHLLLGPSILLGMLTQWNWLQTPQGI